MEKAVLTKYEAEVLESTLTKYSNNRESIVIAHLDECVCQILVDLDLDTLIRALYVGYEVEQTPEDRIRDYYEHYHSQTGDDFSKGIAVGVVTTLDYLNIKYKGVNDDVPRTNKIRT